MDMDVKGLTVADLIRALAKLPPGMELWHRGAGDNEYQMDIYDFEVDGNSGLDVCDGRLYFTYDTWLDGEVTPLDFSE